MLFLSNSVADFFSLLSKTGSADIRLLQATRARQIGSVVIIGITLIDARYLLSYEGREALKGESGVGYIVAVYACSLAAQGHDIARHGHPSFRTYARGVMAWPYAPDFIKNDPDLLERYPPRALRDLGSGLYFDPAESP